MELPLELREIIEEKAAAYPLKRLSEAAKRVLLAYRSERSGEPLVTDAAGTLAYAAVRMPATYGAAFSALSKAAELFGGEIHTMLDAGAGCGAASFAAAEIFPDIERISCIEREAEMSALGQTLMQKSGFAPDVSWTREALEKAELPKADLVTASYVMNELSESARAALTKRLWEAAEKLLILIEPGTPEGYSGMLKMRETLLSAGARIIAPCPHGNACPLPEGDWCHFTVRVARTKLHKALKGGEVPYEDEKFCFIAAARGGAAPCGARVLRHPKIESGKITLRLCTESGIEERVVTKKSPDFKRARKSDSGDSFR